MNPKDDKTTRTRRQYSAEEKVRLLKLHLADGKPISVICDQHQIHPTLFCCPEAGSGSWVTGRPRISASISSGSVE
jgi:hypothetical protein